MNQEEEIEEIELDRRERLAKAIIRNNMTDVLLHERYCCELGYREAMHVAFIYAESVENYLLDHPAVLFDKEAHRLALAASDALYDLYQTCGALECESLGRDKKS